ncbi:hypothetical protein [Streptomyces murinus]|uniref:hypothetical protein n=1 Tax=Streptomyces murinus TaxID=33900 RepID=UPI0018F5554F|nr:hypothetical protein [Streptomyces murinus]
MGTQSTPVSFMERQAARERNELSYQSTCSYHGLPEAHVAARATESAVLVTATDMDVLAEWLFVQGGRVTTVELPSGQTAWTLATTTWTDSPAFPPVPVFVTVVQASDEPVMCEIAEAMRTARKAVAA